MNFIELNNVSYKYGTSNEYSINSVDLNINKGETVILLGHNGAGKTTLIKILSKILKIKEGEAVLNYDDCILNLSVTQLIADLNLLDNLKYFANLNKHKVINDELLELLNRVGLSNYTNKRASELSEGNKQKLMIARALMLKSELILLDEPTSGLDPLSKKQIHSLLNELKKLDSTVILTSHDLEETLEVADRIIFLRQGQIIFDKYIDEINSLLTINIYESNSEIDNSFLLNDIVENRYISLYQPNNDNTYTYRNLNLLDLYYLLQRGQYDEFISQIKV